MNIKRIILFFCFLSFCTALCFAQLTPLPIPPTLTGPVYNLNMQHGTRQFFPGRTSATMGFNGSLLGPTLIMNAGQQVSMNVTNSIGEETTVHWHGFHVAAENDGGPHTVIQPNTTWTPSFTVLDKASTYWYHPHLHDSTSKHVTLGLAGMIIVKDAEEAALNLPRTYGVDDIPLILQTKEILLDGKINYFRAGNPAGNRDSTMLTNGVRNATFNAPRQYVRFRILNGSAQRVFRLGLSNNASFYQIGSDGGLLANRQLVTRVRLAPGERAEIAINFAPYAVGTNLQLVSYGNELPTGTWGATIPWIQLSGTPATPGYNPNPLNGTAFNVLRFTVVAATVTPAPVTTIPVTLATVTPIPEASATVTRNKFLFAGQSAGAKIGSTNVPADATAFALGTIDDVIPLGSTEIWTLHGSVNMYHPFHIHDIQFYVLDRRDSLNNLIPLTASELGRKDVVYVGPKETVRFITKFDDFWGDVSYMYHCHITAHEDAGMMKQFIVTRRLYVDKNYGGFIELGTQTFPYNTLAEAVNAATDGTTIYIVSNGNHEEINATAITTTKKITIKVVNGAAIIK
jgi:FtsP/CotA-like multicopper oxidase with cupredoxin domain